MLLNHGNIEEIGNPNQVIKKYLQTGEDMESNSYNDLKKVINNLPKDSVFRLKEIKLRQNGKIVYSHIADGSPFEVSVIYRVYKRTTGLRVFLNLLDIDENIIFRSFHDEDVDEIPTMDPGYYCSTAFVPANILGPINYKLCINAAIFNKRNLLPIGGICVPLKVGMSCNYNRAYNNDTFYGKLALSIKWNTKQM
jgi:hypothetical protein